MSFAGFTFGGGGFSPESGLIGLPPVSYPSPIDNPNVWDPIKNLPSDISIIFGGNTPVPIYTGPVQTAGNYPTKTVPISLPTVTPSAPTGTPGVTGVPPSNPASSSTLGNVIAALGAGAGLAAGIAKGSGGGSGASSAPVGPTTSAQMQAANSGAPGASSSVPAWLWIGAAVLLLLVLAKK